MTPKTDHSASLGPTQSSLGHLLRFYGHLKFLQFFAVLIQLFNANLKRMDSTQKWTEFYFFIFLTKSLVKCLLLFCLRYYYSLLQAATDYFRLLQPITAYYRLLQTTTGYYSLLQPTTGCYRLIQPTTGYYSLLQPTTGCYRLLQATTGYHRILQVNTC